MPTLGLQLKTLPYLFLAMLVPLVGCGGKNPYFDDDEGAPKQSGSATSAHPDNLSQPYALGTKVQITVRSDGNDITSGWQLKSDNPAVLTVNSTSVTDNKYVTADCTATGEGDTMIRTLDEGGKEQRAAAISVGTPDKMRVFAHGLLRVSGQTDAGVAAAEVQEARVLATSRAVYGILYFRGAQRLYGHGILQFDPVAQLQAEAKTSSGGANNEWLFVKPMAPNGSFSLNLRRGATPMRMLPVLVVPEAELTAISLSQEMAADPAADQQLWVTVQANDGDGNKVQGVYTSYTLDGAAQVGMNNDTSKTTGDLFRFNYAAGATKNLVATHGTLSASLTVQASKGYVADTTYLGCSMSSGRRAPGSSGSILLMALCGLYFLRRRTRAI